MTQMRFTPLIAAAIAVTGLAIGTTTSIAQGQPPGASTPPVGMLHVQRNVHMLVVDGMNIAVQVGDDGVLLVDAATAAVAPQVIAAIRTLSPKPIHTIINTHVHPDHTGGNESLVKQRGTGAPQAVRVIAHQTVQDRMIAAAPAGSSGGSFDSRSASCDRARRTTAVQITAASSAATPIATNGARGYGTRTGGRNGAGSSLSFGCSTDFTGTVRLRNRTPPDTPLSAIGFGSKVRITTRVPFRDTISYEGDGSRTTRC